MIRIGIVDDEKMFRDKITGIVKDVLETESTKAEIKRYSDGNHFFEAVSAGERFDILLADIRMPGVDGMKLGRKMRQSNPGMYIIFITSYEEYAAESYCIEAFQYILKQDLERRLPGVIRELARRLADQNQGFRIVGNGIERVKIPYRDIIYLYKSKGAKYVNYVTEDGIFRERISLDALLKELNHQIFIPVERGYVVNMKHICRISGDTLYLEKGYEVQISRARLAKVKQEISRCWGGK